MKEIANLRKKHSKKGMNLGDLYPVILTIALVAILLAIVLFVMGSFQETVPTEQVSVTNETGAYINSTGYTVNDADACEFQNFQVTEARNATDGTTISTSEYTVDSADGTITNATATTYSDVNLDYTYDYGGKSCDALDDISSDFQDFVPWIGVILLVIAAAIVLGIVIRSFAGQGRI